MDNPQFINLKLLLKEQTEFLKSINGHLELISDILKNRPTTAPADFEEIFKKFGLGTLPKETKETKK